MLVQEVPALTDLLLVELCHEAQMDFSASTSLGGLGLIPSLIVEGLPGAELSTRRAPDEEGRLLLGDEPAGSLPPFKVLEVPGDAILVVHREVQGESRDQLQARKELSCRRDARRRVDLGDHAVERLSSLTAVGILVPSKVPYQSHDLDVHLLDVFGRGLLHQLEDLTHRYIVTLPSGPSQVLIDINSLIEIIVTGLGW